MFVNGSFFNVEKMTEDPSIPPENVQNIFWSTSDNVDIWCVFVFRVIRVSQGSRVKLVLKENL